MENRSAIGGIFCRSTAPRRSSELYQVIIADDSQCLSNGLDAEFLEYPHAVCLYGTDTHVQVVSDLFYLHALLYTLQNNLIYDAKRCF